jgi:hypothetical protein
MNSNSIVKQLVVPILVITFAVLLTAGFMYGLRQLTGTQPALAPVAVTPSPTPVSPASAPTLIEPLEIPDDWLTYRNEEFGFEFLYPGEVKIQTPNKENSRVLFSLELAATDDLDKKYLPPDIYQKNKQAMEEGETIANQVWGEFSFFVRVHDALFEELVQRISEEEFMYNTNIILKNTIIEENSFYIGGIEGQQLIYQRPKTTPGIVYNISYFTEKDDLTYEISWRSFKGAEKYIGDTVQKAILSSFRFE